MILVRDFLGVLLFETGRGIPSLQFIWCRVWAAIDLGRVKAFET